MEKFFFSSLGKVSKGCFWALCERSREKKWGIFPCNDCYIRLAGIVALDLGGPSGHLRRRNGKVMNQARATATWYVAFLFVLCGLYQATPGQLHASLCSETLGWWPPRKKQLCSFWKMFPNLTPSMMVVCFI